MYELVSVCIPTYNGEEFLLEALNSVNNQSYKIIEIVISDDNSSDNSLNIINEFKTYSNFPVKVFNHKPSGIGANWNNCIEKANGKYIKFLFQDDVLNADCILKMMNVFNNNKKLGLVGCKREFVYGQNYFNADLKQWIYKYSDLQNTLALKSENGLLNMTSKSLRNKNFFRSPLNKFGEPSTFMFKKGVLKKIGFFREDLEQILDYEFCNRVLKKFDVSIINENLVKFRLHENQATNLNRSKSIKDYEIFQKIIEKDFFWYLNYRQQIYILRKNYKLINYLFIIKSKFKR